MRHATLVLAITGSLCAYPAVAQTWFEFVESEELFSVNLPHAPAVEEFTYHSGYHAELPAKKYTASDAQADYSVTVVNFAPTQLTGQRAAWDLRGSVAHAAWEIRKRGGEITHDDWVQIDRIDGHQLQISNADRTRSYVQIHSHGTRLYIVEARAAPEATPPIHFQQSLSILDENGDIVRYANAASTGRRNTLAQTEESEFVLTSQRHSPWFTLHEKAGPWNHCQPSSNGNVKRLL